MVNWQWLSFLSFPKRFWAWSRWEKHTPSGRSRADLPSRTEGTGAGDPKLAAGGSSLEVLLEVPAAQILGMN